MRSSKYEVMKEENYIFILIYIIIIKIYIIYNIIFFSCSTKNEYHCIAEFLVTEWRTFLEPIWSSVVGNLLDVLTPSDFPLLPSSQERRREVLAV